MVAAFSSRSIKIAVSFLVALFFVIAFTSLEHSDRLLLFNDSRKLLGQALNETASTKKKAEPRRTGDGCSPDDLVIYQAQTTPLPNGIPTYTVRVLNECLADGCRIGNIHLACGSYSSFRLVNPRIFRRLRRDDCLVNDGRPIAGGQAVSFQYANTYPCRLSLSSATCL